VMLSVWFQVRARRPVLALTCVVGSRSARCEARGKAQVTPVPSGGRRREEDWTGELLELSLMPREGALVDVLLVAGTQGLAVVERQAPAEHVPQSGKSTAVLGV
jgi:hypothetical protein